MAALTLRQDGKEVPCRTRSRYWAPPSSLRLRPAQWRGSFPRGLSVGGFGPPSSISPQPPPPGSCFFVPALPPLFIRFPLFSLHTFSPPPPSPPPPTPLPAL